MEKRTTTIKRHYALEYLGTVSLIEARTPRELSTQVERLTQSKRAGQYARFVWDDNNEQSAHAPKTYSGISLTWYGETQLVTWGKVPAGQSAVAETPAGAAADAPGAAGAPANGGPAETAHDGQNAAPGASHLYRPFDAGTGTDVPTPRE